MDELMKERLIQAIDQHEQQTRPFVTLTFAQSLDGSIAAVKGTHLVISSKQSLCVTHELRTLHDGILVGIGTVLSDNPMLTTRLVVGPSPTPIVIDPRLSIPVTANVLKRPSVIICSASDMPEVCGDGVIDCPNIEQSSSQPHSAKFSRLVAIKSASPDCTIIALKADSSGRITWPDILQALHPRFRSVMIEGGQHVISSIVESMKDTVVDHVLVTVAPIFIGGPRSLSHVMPSGLPRLHSTLVRQCSRDAIIQGFTAIASRPEQRTTVTSSIAPIALVGWLTYNAYVANKLLCHLLSYFPLQNVRQVRTRILFALLIVIARWLTKASTKRNCQVIEARSHVDAAK